LTLETLVKALREEEQPLTLKMQKGTNTFHTQLTLL
jgi:hypothetical protein